MCYSPRKRVFALFSSLREKAIKLVGNIFTEIADEHSNK
jgi:hypothetical protein